MKIFRVGGAVRDALLGLPVKDVDYVVTGTTPEQMIAAGFTPVGKDFPVFLHPQTHAEYALARTERKSAPGYHGFVFHCAPDVTLEQDLQRRDLTVNAMAIAEKTDGFNLISDTNQAETPSDIIDPFGGQRDLSAKVFRHVSDAFLEDPVRILRVARFSARLNTFSIAPETMELMRHMVQAGEVDALVPERVWQEITRGFMEIQPSRMIEVLHECGALTRIMPELCAIFNQPNQCDGTGIPLTHILPSLTHVDYAAQQGYSLAVRWAALLMGDKAANAANTHSGSTFIVSLCARLKAPAEVRDIALMAWRERAQIEVALSLQPESINQLFERCDAFRRPERFIEVMRVIHCTHPAPPDFPQQSYLTQALTMAKAIPAGKIAQETMQRFPHQPQQIATAIAHARVNAIRCLGTDPTYPPSFS